MNAFFFFSFSFSLYVCIRENLENQARRAPLEREVDPVLLVAEVTTPRRPSQWSVQLDQEERGEAPDPKGSQGHLDFQDHLETM